MPHMQHVTGPNGGRPCTRCGVKYSQKTAYLPCFDEGDTLETWVARHADTLLALEGEGSVPHLLVGMASEVREAVLKTMCDLCQSNYRTTDLSVQDLKNRRTLCDRDHRAV